MLRAELVPGMIGVYQVYLQLSASQTTNPQAQLTIAQSVFVSNIVTIPVFASPLLSSVACDPTTFNSGGTTTCTVTLSVAVATGATLISLSSSDSLLTLPGSVSGAGGRHLGHLHGHGGHDPHQPNGDGHRDVR